jgi:hypothetical protein
MSLKQVKSEYQKRFRQSLNVEEYGVFTLRNLFMKIGDVMELVAKDELSICLKSSREGHSALQWRMKDKGNGILRSSSL